MSADTVRDSPGPLPGSGSRPECSCGGEAQLGLVCDVGGGGHKEALGDKTRSMHKEKGVSHLCAGGLGCRKRAFGWGAGRDP